MIGAEDLALWIFSHWKHAASEKTRAFLEFSHRCKTTLVPAIWQGVDRWLSDQWPWTLHRVGCQSDSSLTFCSKLGPSWGEEYEVCNPSKNPTLLKSLYQNWPTCPQPLGWDHCCDHSPCQFVNFCFWTHLLKGFWNTWSIHYIGQSWYPQELNHCPKGWGR